MITMTNEQLLKIELLDKLFGALSVDQLREFTESEQVVSILKGTNNNPEMLKRLIQEHDVQMMDIMTMKSDIASLKSDLQSLLRVLHADVFTPRYNQDFSNLKSKHQVY
jgi:hypothetical protein